MKLQIKIIVIGFICIVILAAAFLWLTTKSPNIQGAFRIGYQRTMLYLPIFVAKERGFFSSNGLEVELVQFGSANEMAQALATNRIDATGMSSLTVLANLEKNSPGIFEIYLVEVLTKDFSPDALVVQNTSNIKSLIDIRKKRLGLHPGTTLRNYADKILNSAMGEDHGVTYVPLQPQIQIQSLEAGSIDALYTLEPIPTVAEGEFNARIIERGLLASYINDPFYGGAGVISSSVIKSRPDAVSAFRAAINEALMFIDESEEISRKIMILYTSISEETALHMRLVQWIKPATVALEEWRTTIHALVEMGLMPSEVSLEQAFMNR